MPSDSIKCCGCGVIGSRARLRIWCREAWGFESLHPHQPARCGSFIEKCPAHVAKLVNVAVSEAVGNTLGSSSLPVGTGSGIISGFFQNRFLYPQKAVFSFKISPGSRGLHLKKSYFCVPLKKTEIRNYQLNILKNEHYTGEY